jgi:hypothetical protein
MRLLVRASWFHDADDRVFVCDAVIVPYFAARRWGGAPSFSGDGVDHQCGLNL